MAEKLISDETLIDDDSRVQPWLDRVQPWLDKETRKPREPRYRRLFVYRVDDKPTQTYPYHYRLLPHEVVIELFREQESAPWRILRASVRGPRIYKGDRVSGVEVEHLYSCASGRVTGRAAPEWFKRLVARTYQRAERERISASAP